MTWRCQDSLLFGQKMGRFAKVGKHLFPIKLSIECIHFRQLSFQFGTEAFAQAAHHNQFGDASLLFGLNEAENGIYGFFLS